MSCLLLAQHWANKIYEIEYEIKNIQSVIGIYKEFDYDLSPSKYPVGILRHSRDYISYNRGFTESILDIDVDIYEYEASGYLFSQKKKYKDLQEKIEKYIKSIQETKMYINKKLKEESILKSDLMDIQKELSIYKLNNYFGYLSAIINEQYDFRKKVREFIERHLKKYKASGYIAVAIPKSKHYERRSSYIFIKSIMLNKEDKPICIEKGYRITTIEPLSLMAFAELSECVCDQPFIYKMALSLASNPLQSFAYVELRLKQLGLDAEEVIELAKSIWEMSSRARGLLAKAVAHQMMFVQMHIREDIPFLPDVPLSALERLERERLERLKEEKGICCGEPYRYETKTDLIVDTCYAPTIYGGLAVSIITQYNYTSNKIIVNISVNFGEGRIKVIKPKTVATLKSEDGYPLAFVVSPDGSVEIQEIKGGVIPDSMIIPVGITPEDLINLKGDFGDMIWIYGNEINSTFSYVITREITRTSTTHSKTVLGYDIIYKYIPLKNLFINYIANWSNSYSYFTVSYSAGILTYRYNITISTTTVNVNSKLKILQY